MKKPIKILVLIGSFVLAVAIGLSLYIEVYLTDERIRAFLSEAAEKSLKRKVTLGSIQVSLWKGIVVNGFEVKEKNSEASLFKTKNFVLKYRILPLLTGRLAIDKLSIVEPLIHIRKDPDGTFNFSDIVSPEEEKEAAKASPSRLPVTMSIEAISIQKALIEYSDQAGTVKKARVTVNANLDLSAESTTNLVSHGKIEVFVQEVVIKDRPKPVRNVQARASYRIEADMHTKKVFLHSIEGDLMEVPVSLKGQIAYGGPALYEVTISVAETNLSTLKDILTGVLPEGLGLGGRIMMSLRGEKKPTQESRPVLNGKVVLKGVSISYKGMKPVLNGTVNLTTDRITLENFELRTGNSSTNILGRIVNYTDTPDVQIDLKSKMLSLDTLIPPPSAVKQTRIAPQPKGEEKEIEPIKTKVKASGSVYIEKALFRGMAIQNLKGSYIFKDNVLKIVSMGGTTFGGSFSVQSSVDLSQRGLHYTLGAEVNDVKVESLVNAFTPKGKDIVSGRVSGKTDISGIGTVKDMVKRNLKGKGAFAIKDGTLKNIEVASSLLAFLGLRELQEIRMEKANVNFSVADRIVNLDSLIESKDMIIHGKGILRLPDEGLDIGIAVKVSERLIPKVLNKLAIAGFLSEEKGWSSIPLRLGGTLTKPSYSIDTRAVGRKATEKVKKKLGEEIFKALSGDKEKKEDAEKKQEKPGRDLFKGIFGK